MWGGESKRKEEECDLILLLIGVGVRIINDYRTNLIFLQADSTVAPLPSPLVLTFRKYK